MRSYQALALVASALSTLVAGLPVDNKAEHPLRVTLTQTEDSVIKATIENTGNEPLGLFKGNELMTDLADRSLTVYGPDGEVPFEGIDPRWMVQGISADQFITLMPGEKTSTSNDLDKIYDLSKGGDYTVVAEGYFSTAPVNSTEVTKSDYYKSRPLKIKLDPKRKMKVHTALAIHRARIAKRATLQSDCSGQQKQALEAALAKCAQIADQASQNAMGNDPNFESFFKTTDQGTKKQVSDRLKAVAQECGSQGKLKYHCTGQGDPNGDSSACQRSGSGGVIAYTISQLATVWTCDLFYELPADPACGRNDQATTTLHEFTHNDAVFQPGTKDIGYGFQNCQTLSTDQALQNADSFSFYASTTINQCNGKTSGGGAPGGGAPGGGSPGGGQPGGRPGAPGGGNQPGGRPGSPGGAPNGPGAPGAPGGGNRPGSPMGPGSGSPMGPGGPQPPNQPGGSPFPPTQPPNGPGSGSSPGSGGSMGGNPFFGPGSDGGDGEGGDDGNNFFGPQDPHGPPQDPNQPPVQDPNGNPFFGGPEGGDDNNLGDGGDGGNNFPGGSPFPGGDGGNGDDGSGFFMGPGPGEGGDDGSGFMQGGDDGGPSFGSGPEFGGGNGPEEFGGNMLGGGDMSGWFKKE